MRYVQMTKNLDEASGLGVTRIAGIAEFSSPGTFRLRRESDGAIRVITNVGISFSEQWLRGQVRGVEALDLNKQWDDVTSACQNGCIPLQLVQEWSDRNQRTLVEFRINP